MSTDEIQFGFMPERGTIDAVFILRRKQEEHNSKGKKLYMCSMVWSCAEETMVTP